MKLTDLLDQIDRLDNEATEGPSTSKATPTSATTTGTAQADHTYNKDSQMTELSFTVEGLPAPQGSKRAFNHRHTGRVVMIESAGDRLKVWRQVVTLNARSVAAQQAWEPPTAVWADLVFYLPRPKSHYRTGRYVGQLKPSAPTVHITKPDGDKLTRAVFDSLTDAGVIPDDSAIVGYTTHKQYADHQPTGARITIKETT